MNVVTGLFCGAIFLGLLIFTTEKVGYNSNERVYIIARFLMPDLYFMKKILSVMFITGFVSTMYAQTSCHQRVQLTEKVKEDDGTYRVYLAVTANGSFHLRLLDSSNEQVLKTISSRNTEKIMIGNLEEGKNYNVFVAFDNEQRFKCKTKVLPDVLSIEIK